MTLQDVAAAEKVSDRFVGRVRSRSFGVDPSSGARFDVTKLAPVLEELHERLAGVVIECLPWREFIVRYDRPQTLFYLDPPYWGSEGDYGPGMFSRDDFAAISETLKTLRGAFIMSINDVPEVRQMFKWERIEQVKTTYSVARGKAAKAAELIISSKRGR